MGLKKCIVLDLDNTLWGGIVGEDGMENLSLSLAPPGNGFIAFQQALLDYAHRGVLLAVNSRNNPEDALSVIRTHPNMILKENNFAAMRINWQDKASNLREIAEELNIGLDSLVFLDDDATNRALVRAVLPEVETPDLPENSGEYAKFLNSLPYFPSAATTDEDKMRGNLYVTERLRREEEKLHQNKADFLQSLGLALTVYEDDPTSVTRLAQLTEKTNQFNTNKNVLSESEVLELIKSPDYRVFHARLIDKFGDYGIVLLALVEVRGKIWHIRNMLMSCRAFGRDIERAFLSHIASRASAARAEEISIDFLETAKNAPAKEFVERVFPSGKMPLSDTPAAPSWVQISA